MAEQLTAPHAAADPSIAAASPADAMPRARLHRRVRHGVTQSHNWVQLMKFGAVGASGYAVNLIVYEAVIAFCFAVTNNFMWNRHWTFKATAGHAGFQAARFFVVSLAALAFNLVVLKLLVTAGVGEFPAQAIAIVCATPMNFVGNKLWSFSP
jgi:putative flippase GtrA